ncbi:MAG: hypothetical protein M2R45_01212 [Verrucomicrobia subdivision 3 bacterium]|nr:hypothetical protein [Limisphaerales bacterium]MCS1415236.1 hypothetical protein [Limisphaerales bacterium]
MIKSKNAASAFLDSLEKTGIQWLVIAGLSLSSIVFAQNNDANDIEAGSVSVRAIAIDPITGEEIEIDPSEIQEILKSVRGAGMASGQALILNSETSTFESFELNPEDIQNLFGSDLIIGGPQQTLSRRPGESEEAFQERIASILGQPLSDRVQQAIGQTRTLKDYRELLEIESDEEWQVIKLRLEPVLKLRTKARPGFLGSTVRISGSVRSKLQRAIQMNNSDRLRKAIAAYRNNQKERQTKLQQAREALRTLLTVKQEALLVVAGVLD